MFITDLSRGKIPYPEHFSEKPDYEQESLILDLRLKDILCTRTDWINLLGSVQSGDMSVWGWRWEIHLHWRRPIPEPHGENWKLCKEDSRILNIFAGAQHQCYQKCLGKCFWTSGSSIAAHNFILAPGPGAPAYWNHTSKQMNKDQDAVHAGLLQVMRTKMVDYTSFVKVKKSLQQLFQVLWWIQ